MLGYSPLQVGLAYMPSTLVNTALVGGALGLAILAGPVASHITALLATANASLPALTVST